MFPPEKDFTDTELALQIALTRKPHSIVIYGGSGTRMDHVLGVLQLLESFSRKGQSLVFRDPTNDIRVLSRGRTILVKREGYRYVSIIPITNTITISLTGFKYPLDKKLSVAVKPLVSAMNLLGPRRKSSSMRLRVRHPKQRLVLSRRR